MTAGYCAKNNAGLAAEYFKEVKMIKGTVAFKQKNKKAGYCRIFKICIFVFMLAIIRSLITAYKWEGVPPGYGIQWSDEFSGAIGSYPSAANWAPQTGDGGWGNNELENYTNSPANASIVSDPAALNGQALAITAIDTMPGSTAYSTVGRYTSARLQSLGLHSFQYGYMVARIRLPYGDGIWPAFWMLGTDIGSVGWPDCGEIDMAENIGNAADQPNNHGSLHDGIDWTSIFTLPGGQLFHNDYHTFAAYWQPNQIQFYVDGNLYETVTSAQQTGGTWEFNNTFYFLLNMAVGGNWPGSPDASTTFPQTMYVNYVRAYAQGQPTPVPVAQSTWRVRCGGDDYTDSQGNVWIADSNFTGGWPAATTSGISGNVLPSPSDQALYQYERYGSTTGGTTVTYTFNVPSGNTYQVRLKFAEDYWTAAGDRQFNVAINGSQVLSNFDIFADSGGEYVADDKVYDNISPSNGTITIVFSPGSKDQPKVDAIQILPESMPTLTPTPTPSFTPTYTVTTVPPTCASWIVNGSAFASGNGVTITTAANSQGGSAWNSSCINLSRNFNMTFMTYFGATGGADGMDFVLQNDSRGTAALGLPGGDKGYAGTPGITPSVAFDLETYNSNGTLQVLENGSNTANTCAYAATVCPYVFPSNIANQQEHKYQVVWNASAKTLTLIFDGTVVMVYNRDLVNSVFGGNTCVYYGFTGATGGANNLQYVYEVGCTLPTLTATSTSSPASTGTSTQTATSTSSPTATCTVTNTSTQTATPTPSPSTTPTATASGTLTFTPSYTMTATSTNTKTGTPSATSTITLLNTLTNTSTCTTSDTKTSTFTITPTASATCTVLSATLTATNIIKTSTLTPTQAITISLSATATNTQTSMPTAAPTYTPTASSTFNVQSSMTNTATETASATCTVLSATLTETATTKASATLTATSTNTPADTPTASSTPNVQSSMTNTQTETASATVTATNIIETSTLTPTPAITSSPTAVPAGALTIGPVKPYPNPINPAIAPVLKIAVNITPDDIDSITLKIYTVSYRLIREEVFDGEDAQETAASGILEYDSSNLEGLSGGTYYFVVIVKKGRETAVSKIDTIIILK